MERVDDPTDNKVRDILLQIEAGQSLMASENIYDALDLLSLYECWDPFFRLANEKISKPDHREIQDYAYQVEVYTKNLNNISKAAEVCRRAIRDLPISFHILRNEILVKAIPVDDYKIESEILELVQSAFRNKQDEIDCLERLCMIYEKKVYREDQLYNSYERLLKNDPNNISALKFFKVAHAHSQEWARVIEILELLYKNSRHQNDRYRIAQEMASVFLYQLDKPSAAIETIEKSCLGSPLDTSNIHYEAFYRLRDWAGCLRVLHAYMERVEHRSEKAVVCYKIGELNERLQEVDTAIDFYQKSLSFNSKLYESLESLIEIAIDNADWQLVEEYLVRLQGSLSAEHLKKRVGEAVQRIKGAVE